MKHNRQYTLLSLSVILVLVFSLFSTITAFADDNPPPASTEEAVQPSATGEPAATEVPVVDAPPTDMPVATDTPVSTDIPVEDATIPEALDQLPEGTDLVILDESGDALPLASEEAAQILSMSDPYFTDSGVVYGYTAGSSCPAIVDICASGLVTPLQDAVSAFAASATATGAIYVEAGSYTENVTFDGSIGNLSNLTGLIGAGSGSTILTGNYIITGMNAFTFSGFNVVGNITADTNSGALQLSDIVQTGGSNGISVINHFGDINLTNVTASGNSLTGASLNNVSGGNVNLTGVNNFNSNGISGLDIHSNDVVNIENVTANGNGGSGVSVETSNNVTLNNVTANNNGDNGIKVWVHGAGFDVTANDLTAIGNGASLTAEGDQYGVYIINEDKGSGNVIIGGTNLFRSNDYSGLRIFSNGKVILSGVTSENHTDDYGAEIITFGGDVTIQCSAFNRNWSGVGVFTDHVVTENGVTFSKNSFVDNDVSSGGTFVENTSYNCAPSTPVPTPTLTPTSTPVPFVKEKKGLSLPVNIIPVTGDLDCAHFSGALLTLPDGDRALLPCNIEGKGRLETILATALPGELPGGYNFGSSFNLQVTKDGVEQSVLPSDATISFKIPDGMDASKLAILFWNGAQWVEVDGSHATSDGQFEALVNFTGTFILAQK